MPMSFFLSIFSPGYHHCSSYHFRCFNCYYYCSFYHWNRNDIYYSIDTFIFADITIIIIATFMIIIMVIIIVFIVIFMLLPFFYCSYCYNYYFFIYFYKSNGDSWQKLFLLIVFKLENKFVTVTLKHLEIFPNYLMITNNSVTSYQYLKSPLYRFFCSVKTLSGGCETLNFIYLKPLCCIRSIINMRD